MVDVWKDITLVMAAMPHKRSTGALVEEAKKLFKTVERLVDEIAASGNFSVDWPHVRALIPLQVRLVAEQVFWERGGEWRRYVTGFRPVEPIGSGPSDESIARAGAARKGDAPGDARKRAKMYQKTWGR